MLEAHAAVRLLGGRRGVAERAAGALDALDVADEAELRQYEAEGVGRQRCDRHLRAAEEDVARGIRPRCEFRRYERKLLSFLSSNELKLRRNFREIQNLEASEKPGSERHRAPESPEILKIASNGTISMESPPEPP